MSTRWFSILLLTGFIMSVHHSATAAPAASTQFIPVPLGTLAADAATSAPLIVDGVGFQPGVPWKPEAEGSSQTLTLGGARAARLHVLGGRDSTDRVHPDWGSNDSFLGKFIGDEAGSLLIRYRSGTEDRVPLIYGYTAWWREPLQRSPEPLKSDAAARARLDAALCVANGLEAWDAARTAPYHLTIKLRPEPLASLTLCDSAAKQDHIQIEALSLGGVSDAGALAGVLPGIEVPTAADSPWLAAHLIDSADPFPATRRDALVEVAHAFHTTPADLTDAVIDATPRPAYRNADFNPPAFTLAGDPLARILSNVYEENVHESWTRTDRTGFVAESNPQCDYYYGFGGWTPALGPFHTTAYTRNRTPQLMTAFGFPMKGELALQFFDRWMLYYPQAYPLLQLGGQPVPAHASVVANNPHMYFDDLTHAGWKTRMATRDVGNFETDGHGMLMLSHWRQWIATGRRTEYVETHWQAIREAAEFIPWMLDNPELSCSTDGLLYGETEGGLGHPTLYIDTICYFGLSAYAEMAQAAGHKAEAKRWHDVTERLRGAIERHYPTTHPTAGDVWDVAKCQTWAANHAVLVALIFGLDYQGYDIAQRLPKDWLARTRNTYRLQRGVDKVPFCSPVGFGYNQGYLTEAALLLDEMADSRQALDWIARLCFAPRLPAPYRVPEGATVASDGSAWRRWGDLGNLYQLNEALVVFQIMAGVDDFDAGELKIMPRVPATWGSLATGPWPVQARSGGKLQANTVSYTLRHTRPGEQCEVEYKLAQPVDAGRLRIGPFASATRALEATLDGTSIACELQRSGDSVWGWVSLGNRTSSGTIQMTAH